jgi:uncharacterized membrane protein YoaK (UPF0700 family)
VTEPPESEHPLSANAAAQPGGVNGGTLRRGVPLTVLAAALTFGTGALDVAAFTRLGEVFASVMTGNLVLLGLAAARASATLAIHAGLAFAGYSAGAALGTGIVGRSQPADPTWPRSVTVALLVEAGVLAGFTAGWEITGTRPRAAAQLALLAVAALSMGLQSAAIRRLPVAVSTTYLTGTLTSVIAALITHRRLLPADRRGLAVLTTAGAGAAAGGGLLATHPSGLPALPLTALMAVITYSPGRDPSGGSRRQRRAAGVQRAGRSRRSGSRRN